MTQSWNCWCWQLGLASFLALFGASISSGDCARAQSNIIPDNTLGQENSIVERFEGTSDEVIYGGAQRGSNLFHSFQEFNVSEGRRALFYSSPSAGIQNILARVTGGNPSKIMGILGTYTDSGASPANLFLINPNGILFGPNASLNVGGSFVASTASSVNFADGTSFSATAPQTIPLLTVSVPIGLQFGSTAQSILNQSRATDSNRYLVGLQVQPGKTLALVGGDVALAGGALTAQQGRIELGSVAGTGLVSLAPIDKGWALGYEGVQNFQDIQLSQQAIVDASGEGGGDIQVQGRHITLTDASSIYAITLGRQNGGKISIQASELIAQDASQISAITRDAGQGGSLFVNASDSIKLSGTGTSADGKTIFSGLFSQSQKYSSGAAGDLTIVTKHLLVEDGAQISSNTFGTGQGGNLFVTADSLELSGTVTSADGKTISSGLFTTNEENSIGYAGNLKIATGQLTVQGGAQVSAAAFGSGRGGALNVTASDSVKLSGTSVDGKTPSGLFTQTQGIRAAGNLKVVVTGQLNVRDKAEVSVGSIGSGKAGNLNIVARSITLDNQAALTAASKLGRGGNIKLQARDLLLTRNGSRISAESLGSGDEGNITIDASILAALENSNITASAAGLGANIRINTQGIFFSPDSAVTASGSTTIEGTVEVGNPNVLPQEVVNVAGLITQGCSASGGQAANRFIVTGRGGLPPTPRETLSSDTVLEDWGTLALAPTESLSTEQRDAIENRFGGSAVSSHPTAPEPGPIVEAQGWMIGANGQVVLTAQAPNVTPHNPWQTPADCHTS